MLMDWGLPRKIISDRDLKFTADLWRDLFAALDTELAMVTAYNPKGNGLIERQNQTIEMALRFHIATSDIPWPNVIPALQFHLNSSRNMTGLSPNELTLGFKPNGVLDVVKLDHWKKS